MDSGDRRRLRVRWWIVTLVVVAVGALALLGIWVMSDDANPFHVGACFQTTKDTGVFPADGLREVSGRAKTVDCTAAHDAEITRAVRAQSDCAAEGAWLVSRGQKYCVKLTG